MAKKSTHNQVDESAADKPAVSEVHQRAREAVEALKAVRDELHRQAAALDQQRGEIETQIRVNDEAQTRIGQERGALEDDRRRFQAERDATQASLLERKRRIAEQEERLVTLRSELNAREAMRLAPPGAAKRERVIEPECAEAPRGTVEAMPVASDAGPKSAGTNGAADSRKLRRNTKRKAIGI